MSFFNKLKSEIGIAEKTETEREAEQERSEPEAIKQKPQVKSRKTKKITAQEPKIIRAASQETKKDGAEKQEWPEKSGELAIDLLQSPDFFVIQSAVAGVSPEGLDITLDNDMLIISGERKKPHQDEDEEKPIKYLHQECYWGPFAKKIILPEEIDAAKIEATMKQGILMVKLPRIHKQKIKKITVNEA